MADKSVNKHKISILLVICSINIKTIYSASIDKITVSDCPVIAATVGGDNPYYYDISQLSCRACAQTNEFQTVSDDGKLPINIFFEHF